MLNLSSPFPKFLKVVVMSIPQEVRINATTTVMRRIFNPPDVALTNIFAQSLGFSYELVSPSDGELGRYLPDGNWTGMVGMMQRNEADIIISILSISESRSEVVDFSFPYQRISITFATKKPIYVPDVMSFLSPFSTDVWLAVLICFLILPFLFKVLLKTKYSYGRLFLEAFGIFLGGDISIKPKQPRGYILILSLTIAALILGECYKAILLAYLTVPTLRGVRTIPELAAAVTEGKYECWTFAGAFIINSLLNSVDPIGRTIGISLNKTEGSRDIDGILSKTFSGRTTAFIAGKDFFFPLKEKYFVASDEFFPAMPAVAMHKDFCCADQINGIVLNILSSGIYAKISEHAAFPRSLKYRRQAALVKKKAHDLSLRDFQGPFAIVIVGWILSTIAFTFELIAFRLKASVRIQYSVKRALRIARLRRRFRLFKRYYVHPRKKMKVYY